MDLGIIGLGRMGLSMSIRLVGDGHSVVGYDKDTVVAKNSIEYITNVASSIEELIDALPVPRIVWVMLPSGEPTENTFQQLIGILSESDIIVDGGN